MFDRVGYMRLYHKTQYKNNKVAIDALNTEYYRQHKSEIRQYKKAWYMKHRDSSAKSAKLRYEAHKNGARLKYNLKKLYGLSLDQYNDFLSKQNSVCAICKDPSKTRRLSVDHNHTTGKVRGLLCSRCNFGIGLFKENDELFRLAQSYLVRNL